MEGSSCGCWKINSVLHIIGKLHRIQGTLQRKTRKTHDQNYPGECLRQCHLEDQEAILQSQRDIGVLRALEQMAVSVGWPQTKWQDRFLELRSAQQIVQNMTGTESNKGKSHFIPTFTEWHTDELANATELLPPTPFFAAWLEFNSLVSKALMKISVALSVNPPQTHLSH